MKKRNQSGAFGKSKPRRFSFPGFNTRKKSKSKTPTRQLFEVSQLEPRILLSGSPLDNPTIDQTAVDQVQSGFESLGDLFELVDQGEALSTDSPLFADDSAFSDFLNFGQRLDDDLADRVGEFSVDSEVKAEDLLTFLDELDAEAGYATGTKGEAGYNRFSISGEDVRYDSTSGGLEFDFSLEAEATAEQTLDDGGAGDVFDLASMDGGAFNVDFRFQTDLTLTVDLNGATSDVFLKITDTRFAFEGEATSFLESLDLFKDGLIATALLDASTLEVSGVIDFDFSDLENGDDRISLSTLLALEDLGEVAIDSSSEFLAELTFQNPLSELDTLGAPTLRISSDNLFSGETPDLLLDAGLPSDLETQLEAFFSTLGDFSTHLASETRLDAVIPVFGKSLNQIFQLGPNGLAGLFDLSGAVGDYFNNTAEAGVEGLVDVLKGALTAEMPVAPGISGGIRWDQKEFFLLFDLGFSNSRALPLDLEAVSEAAGVSLTTQGTVDVATTANLGC